MRTEDIVGVTFFIFLLAGAVLVIYGNGQPKLSSRRRVRIAAGLAVEALAFLLFGLLSLYFVHNSPRPEAIGYIENLQQTSGEIVGSRFLLTVNGGPTVALHARYHGHGMQQGELAKVRFVEYSRSLLELTVLSGSTQGWQLTESEGSSFYLMFAMAGAVFGLCALGEYRKRTLAT